VHVAVALKGPKTDLDNCGARNVLRSKVHPILASYILFVPLFLTQNVFVDRRRPEEAYIPYVSPTVFLVFCSAWRQARSLLPPSRPRSADRAPVPRAYRRDEQIASLKAQYAQTLVADPSDASSFDVGLRLVATNQILRIRITLPSGFPEAAAPQIRIVDRRCVHALLEPSGSQVVQAAAVGWDASKNLGWVVKMVMDRLGSPPPEYRPEGTVNVWSNGAVQQQAAPGAGAAYPPPGSTVSQYPPPGAQYPRPGVQQQPQQRAPSPAPAPAPPPPVRRAALSVPPLPSDMGLAGLSVADLTQLLEDEGARAAHLWTHVPDLPSAVALVGAARAAACDSARATLGCKEELEGLLASCTSLEGELEAERASLLSLARRQATVVERFNPVRLARELESVADELDRTSAALAESFANTSVEDWADRFGGGSAGSVVGGFGGGGPEAGPPRGLYHSSTPSFAGVHSAAGALPSPAATASSGYEAGGGLMPGVGSASAASGSYAGGGAKGGGTTIAVPSSGLLALRDFRDEFVSLRKRHHAARIQAGLLRAVGLAA